MADATRTKTLAAQTFQDTPTCGARPSSPQARRPARHGAG